MEWKPLERSKCNDLAVSSNEVSNCMSLHVAPPPGASLKCAQVWQCVSLVCMGSTYESDNIKFYNIFPAGDWRASWNRVAYEREKYWYRHYSDWNKGWKPWTNLNGCYLLTNDLYNFNSVIRTGPTGILKDMSKDGHEIAVVSRTQKDLYNCTRSAWN